MDEATASIDHATDTKLQVVIKDLSWTVITIAHRLQTILNYDQIVILDRGEIVDSGGIDGKREGNVQGDVRREKCGRRGEGQERYGMKAV